MLPDKLGITPFIDFLQYCVDREKPLPDINNVDWKMLLNFAKEQTIIGVFYNGILRSGNTIKMPFPVLAEWIGYAKQIEAKNNLLNLRCVELVNMIDKLGLHCCLLKGQGNSLLYLNPLLRMPGDIDLYVFGGVKVAKKFVNVFFSHEIIAYHHIDFPIFKDVPVEIHYRPIYVNNPIYNYRLQKWFKCNLSRGIKMACLPNNVGTIPIPSVEFNLIYLLAHMMHHYLDEGIGLRQFVDYYYVLQSGKGMLTIDIKKTLKYLNLLDFAEAVMYVESVALGIDSSCLLVPINIKRGKAMLVDIINSGNFGHSTDLPQKKRFYKYFAKNWRSIHNMRYYPAEAMFEPLFRTWHFFWKIVHK